MDRTVEYLLRKYETKDVNEIWTAEHETIYKQNQRYKQRTYILDCIVNERTTKSRGTFKLPPAQKERAKWLIKNLPFTGRTSEQDYIVMILIYTKLEANPNRELRDYYPILNDYQISMQTFVKFLIRLTQYYINKQGGKTVL